jgi:hypothetical protein
MSVPNDHSATPAINTLAPPILRPGGRSRGGGAHVMPCHPLGRLTSCHAIPRHVPAWQSVRRAAGRWALTPAAGWPRAATAGWGLMPPARAQQQQQQPLHSPRGCPA